MLGSFDRRIWAALLMLSLVWVAGCAGTKLVDPAQALPQQHAFEEDVALADVGVYLFDPNVPEDLIDAEKAGIYPDIRGAESRYMAHLLRQVLEESGNWGLVRVLPRGAAVADVFVRGRILSSTPEEQKVEIRVTDASGEKWFTKIYKLKVPENHYEQLLATPDAPQEPFRAIYAAIADDLLAARLKLSAEDLDNLRQLAQMQFASEFATELYSCYVSEDSRGKKTLIRLPSTEDEVFQHLETIRDREYLFVDVADKHYERFYDQVRGPYHQWLHSAHREHLVHKEMKKQARVKKLLGFLSFLGGLLAIAEADDVGEFYGGSVLTQVGVDVMQSGSQDNREADIIASSERDMTQALNTQMGPQVMEMEDQMVALTGTVDEQYQHWREALYRLYQHIRGEIPEGGDCPEDSS